MFTGIVEELGEVLRIDLSADAARLRVRGPRVTADAARGDSISVNGCCLTVTDLDEANAAFTADVMAETLDKTALGSLGVGDLVNLERAATLTTRLGGHIVQGHVDGVGTIVDRTHTEHWDLVRIALPEGLARYLVPKGSITVDGVSLTVVDVIDAAGASEGTEQTATFTVSLIPETLTFTTMGLRKQGAPVNLEVDVLAKYVERLLAHQTRPAQQAGKDAS